MTFSSVEDVFTNKYVTLFIAILFISLSFYIGTHTRDGQVNFDGLRPLVEQNIYSQIRSNIAQQIDAQFPIGTADFKAKLVDQQFAAIQKSGSIPYNNQELKISDIVDQNLAGVKSNFQFPDGQTYMGSIDPYYYYNLANDLYDHGYTGDMLDASGKPRITKMISPVGVAGSYFPEFNIWLIAKTYQLSNFAKDTNDSTRFKAIFMLPVWLSLVAVIPCYLLIRRFSSDLYALFGTLICMTTGIFVSRTLAGSIDNDPYYVIVPLVIAAFFVYALIEKRPWLAIVLAAVAGFFQGFMAWTLGNSWFILFFIIVATIMYLGYLFIESVWHKNYSNLILIAKKEGYILGAYLISSTIFHYLYAQGDIIFVSMLNAITGNLQGIASFDASNIWPNVLSSVAELNPSSFGQVVSSVGGKTIFILGLFGIVLLCLDFKWKRETGKWTKWATILFSLIWFGSIVSGGAFQSLIANNALLFLVVMFVPVVFALLLSVWNNNVHPRVAVAILLSVWMAGTIYMSFNGVRFIMLLGPAFAIAFALSLYYIAKTINNFGEHELGISDFILKNIFGVIVAAIIFLFVFSPMYTQAMQMSSQPAILFDRAWFDAMDALRANSSPDAIVTSWWDFGHFFRAIGQRGVTFDGASQTTPQSHWVGRLLMENNETVARNMLRMLNCGGNTAFDVMLNYSRDPTNGILVNKLIYETFRDDSRSAVESRLQNNEYFNFTQVQTQHIMTLLACENPRESVFVTSGDMVGKASVWAHWGSWDFTKKYVFDNYKSKSIVEIAKDLHESPALISQYVNELNKLTAVSRSQNIKYTDLVNQWFAPYPGYYPGANGYFATCTENGAVISCDNTVSLTRNSTTFSVTSNLQIPSISRVIFVMSDGSIIYDQSSKLAAGTQSVDAVFMKTGDNSYSLLMAQTPLGGSLFTRLFFLNGQTTKYFDPIGSFTSQTQGKISLWKTNWTRS